MLWSRMFGTGPLLLATAGFLVIGLLKTPLRWSGAVAVLAAAIWETRAARFGESGEAEVGGRARDATPRQEDIEANE